MPPHFDRHTDIAGATQLPGEPPADAPDEAAMEDAAEALRQAEIESVQPAPEPRSIDAADLDRMNIDDLRVLAKELDVPERAAITEKDDLIAAIRDHLEANPN